MKFIVLIIFFTVLVNYNLRDRHPDFNIDISLKNNGQVSTISVGFAKMPITPDVTDTWNDLNGNAKYEPIISIYIIIKITFIRFILCITI